MNTLINEPYVKRTLKQLNNLKNQGDSVVAGLSGGVDSAVSAWFLKQAGFKVTPVFMDCYPNEPGCSVAQDKKDAIRVATHLGLSLQVVNLQKEYKEQVLDYFYEEYFKGKTPNPDIVCNQKIKFGTLFGWLDANTDFDWFATGHYARKQQLKGTVTVKSALDEKKDQSYFLYKVQKTALARTIFPLGNVTKKHVRSIAQRIGLPIADKPDSTGICFVGDVGLKEFLQKRFPEKRGKVVTKEGKEIGTHAGVHFYTIGQRRGFEKTLTEPVYVLKKDIKNNILVVGNRDDIQSQEFSVESLVWNDQVTFDTKMYVRIRNLGSFTQASLHKNGRGGYVVLEEPIEAIAPGQSAVFYDKQKNIVGGGIIASVEA